MAQCNPKNIILKSDMRNVRNYRDGRTEDIITTIMRMDREANNYIDADAAKCLLGETEIDTLRNVWKFVKSNVRYKTDRPGKEVVKSPAALFTIGQGDCKSFSITEAALLRALGFKGIRYRFTAYDNRPDASHVYIVCKLRGKDVILDAVHSRFDDEVAYTFKKDIPAAKASGIGALPAGAQNTYTTVQLIGLGLIAWAFFR